MKKIICILSLCLSCISPISFALSEQQQCEFNGIDFAKAKSFVAHLKTALSKNDKTKLANLISYPLRVNQSPSKHYAIKTKQSFILHYAKLFPAKTRKAILEDQGIFCNYQGAMIGSGTWFMLENNSMKIFAINPN